MLENADEIICMEEVHKAYILEKIDKSFDSKIKVLHLGDTETFMSSQLIDRLWEVLE